MVTEEKNLLNGYFVSGTDEESMEKELKNMDSVTHVKLRSGKELILLSIAKIDKFAEPEKTTVYVLSDSYVSGFNERGEALHVANAADYKIGKKLLKEAKDTTGLLAVIDGEFYVVGSSALATFSQRTGVSGETTLTRNGIIRDLHFADGLFINNEKTSIVYREAPTKDGETVRKIFAFLGKRYIPIEQSALAEILNKFDDEKLLGKTELRNYRIGHDFTDIYIDFPEAAKDIKDTYHLSDDIVPGMFLCTSDTGMSSVICRGTYRIGNSYFTMNEVAKKHTASNTVEEFVKACDKEIFPDYRKLPEALASLMGEELINYAKTDLSTKEGKEENKARYIAVIKALSGKLFPPAIIPAKVKSALIEAVAAEMNPEVHYSLYDVAVTFMGLTDRTEGLLRAQLEVMRKASAKAPYVLQDKKFLSSVKTEKEEEEDIILLPE